MEHVHLIGIGGTGLSAIALVLLESGYEVSGSDRTLSLLARRAQAAGARVFTGHHPENVRGADLIVRSSAIADDNVEVQAALQAGIPVLKRSDFLGRLMQNRIGIAIAGTHGKTTTTAMLAWALSALGQDPTFIIGGVSANLGTNARAGKGPHFVIEADEYDHMFLGLAPEVAVVTNIEHDHPDCYPTAELYQQAFRDFAERTTPDGLVLVCAQDAGAASLGAQLSGCTVRTYGLQAENDLWADALESQPGAGYRFEVVRKNGMRPISRPVQLQVPGEHNVLNALAVLSALDWLGFSMEAAAEALERFTGAGRRFEVRGQAGGITVVDDYAHHPTEIQATLKAARNRYPDERVWAVWQPHTYSRTRLLAQEFVEALQVADRAVILPIYAAREAAPEDGFTAQFAADALGSQAWYAPDFNQARLYLMEHLKPGDVVLVLSAGDAEALSADLFDALRRDPPGRLTTGKPRSEGD